MRSEGLLSIVIPVYGSETSIASTLEEYCEALEKVCPYELVLVNDDSPDNVQEIIDRFALQDHRIKSIRLAHNIGQHRATLRGFAETRGEVVVTVDDDGQNPPSAALAVASELRKRDLDIVYGRFTQSEHKLMRRLASRLNRSISRVTLRNNAQVSINNVRALRGDFARWLGGIRSSYPYIDALVFRATSRIGEVDVEHRARVHGRSTYGYWKLLNLWISHLTSLTLVPLQFAVIGSFGVSILAFMVGSVQMLKALLEREAPPGWLSLFTSIAFLFGVLFMFLGILSVYVGRMYVSMNEQFLVWERSRSPGASRTAESMRAK